MEAKDQKILNNLLEPQKRRELQRKNICPFERDTTAEKGFRLVKSLLPHCLDYLIEEEKHRSIQQFHQKLSRAFFLYKWNMTDSAAANLDDEMNVALKSEHFEIVLDFLRLKRAIIASRAMDLDEAELLQCTKEILDANRLLAEHIPYLDLHATLLSYVMVSIRATQEEKELHRAKALELKGHPLLVDDLALITLRSKILYRKCRSMICSFGDDVSSQIVEHEELLNELSEKGELHNAHQEVFLTTCHRLGILQLTIGNNSEVKKYIDMIEEFVAINPKLELHRIQSMIDMNFQYVYDHKNWKELLPQIVRKLEKNYEQFSNSMRDEYVLLYFINVGRSYFRLKKFRNAGDFLETMPPKLLRKKRADVWAIAEILKLACMFEEKDYRLLLSKAPVAYNKISRYGFFPTSYRAIVNFFRRTNFMLLDRRQKQKKFESLSNELNSIYDKNPLDRSLGEKLLAWNDWALEHSKK